METGGNLKLSFAASVMAHAVLLGALLFLAGSSMSGGERQVFYVELKDARLVAPGPGKVGEAETSRKTLPEPLKRAMPEKERKKVERKPPPAVDEEAAPETETISSTAADLGARAADAEEVAEIDAVSEGGVDFSADAGEATDERGMLDADVENFVLSSGPGDPGNEFLAKIRRAIEEELTYPPLARRRKMEGTVVVGFGIDRSGMPTGIEIVESSGFSVLDREVIEIIRRASPFPYIPERVEVPVSFRLVEGRH